MELTNEYREMVIEQFKGGIEKGKIAVNLIKAGLPVENIGSIATVINKVLTDGGLIRDPKIIRAEVIDFVEDCSLEERNSIAWSDIESLIKDIQASIGDAGFKMINNVIRNFLESHGFDMPEKPRVSAAGRRTSAVKNRILEIFKENAEVSMEDFTEKLASVVTSENALEKYKGMFNLFSALAKIKY
jgi:hypothetical protein